MIAPPPISAGAAAQASFRRDQGAARQDRKNALVSPMAGLSGSNPLASGSMPAGRANALSPGGGAPMPSSVNMLAGPRPMMPAPVAPPSPPPPPGMAGAPAGLAAPDPNALMAQAMQHAAGAGLSPSDVDAQIETNITAMHHLGRLLNKGSTISKGDATKAAIEAAQAGVISSDAAASFVSHIGDATPSQVAGKIKGLVVDFGMATTALHALKQQPDPGEQPSGNAV